jgi:hypothetical protein
VVIGRFCLPFSILVQPDGVHPLERCLGFLEATGICAGAWFLGIIHKKVAGFQLNEVYVGTPKERAAQGMADDKSVASNVHLGTHGFVEDLPKSFVAQFSHNQNFSKRRAQIISNIAALREEVKLANSGEEKEAFEASL